MCKNHVDVLSVIKICERCAKYQKIFERIVLKVRKFCNRCAEPEKNVQEMYFLWENSGRCTKWENIMQEMRGKWELIEYKKCIIIGRGTKR